MNAFNFKLEKILNLRAFYEKQAEIALGQAIAARDAISLRLKKIAELLASRSLNTTDNNAHINMNDLTVLQNYVMRLNAEKEELLNQLTCAEENIKIKREQYIKASKDRQVISKLKEKKSAEWKKKNLQQEYSVIDDFVTFQTKKTE